MVRRGRSSRPPVLVDQEKSCATFAVGCAGATLGDNVETVIKVDDEQSSAGAAVCAAGVLRATAPLLPTIVKITEFLLSSINQTIFTQKYLRRVSMVL